MGDIRRKISAGPKLKAGSAIVFEFLVRGCSACARVEILTRTLPKKQDQLQSPAQDSQTHIPGVLW
jgi:hypothetical protein